VSIAVPLDELAAEVGRRGPGYLLTVGDDQRTRIAALDIRARGDDLVAGGAGPGARANLAARPDVSLLWPPVDDGGMSLIVDGRARLDGELVVITPTWAVLHRPAPPFIGG
jgi:hypothetical protein